MDGGERMIPELIMITVGIIFIILGIKYKMEPLLLVPIGFASILVNIPGSELALPEGIGNVVHWIFSELIATEVVPCLIFFCLGAMTDFGPLISNPKTFIIGAAAQLGVAVAFVLAMLIGFTPLQAASIGIIGGADGPTTIFLTTSLAPEILGATAVAAYSYMSLVPIIQPPVAMALTTKGERKIRMKKPRDVNKREKIIFPILLTIVAGFVVPASLPLIGLLLFGNLLRESGVTERLSKTAENDFMNILTILLGLGIGGTMMAEAFLTLQTLEIIALGAFAFVCSTAGGVLIVKLMNLFVREKINPLIGCAGVSAVPMSARVAQTLAAREDRQNYILMHAMGPNVAGVIGTAMSAGLFLQFL
ncbi:MAG: sodium ion-translocating decarboxylase subunit beta [Candidatus Thermoplasmatota archaeon]|nr:sodium ion-translocating decarboxylase subunit beta [Candidatus Thermoplasmatota archaeon]